MPGFIFDSDEALAAVLRAGAVPRAVTEARARVRREPGGRLVVTPDVGLPEGTGEALAAWGVARAEGELTGQAVGSWFEALACRPAPLPEGPVQEVLLRLQPGASLAAVCGELLRLGCDRVAVAPGADGRALLRVEGAPWYLLSRALEGEGPVRAFVPTGDGSRGVFVELGARHPLTGLLRVEGALLLVPGEGPWARVPDGPWTLLEHLLELEGAGAPLLPGEAALPRIAVRPRLVAHGGVGPVAAFVVEQGQAAAEGLAATLPQAWLEQLLFAVAGTTVVLVPRPGHAVGPGELPGVPHTRLAELPNLLVPQGFALEPPLKRETLRAWLAADDEVLTWLAPTAGGFQPVRLPLSAFRPLSEWVDYVLDGEAQALTAWAQGATFALGDFVAVDAPAPASLEQPSPTAVAPVPPRPAVLPRTPAWGVAPAAPLPGPPASTSSPSTSEAAPAAPSAAPAEALQTPGELDEALVREEAAFLELETPADSPARRDGWVRLATLYARAQRPREAGLAWAHALWDAPEGEAPALAARWAATSGVQLASVLGQAAPSADQARGAVAHLVLAALSPQGRPRPAGAAAFLDRSDESLDVRSAWLGRWAEARLAGGDTLGLARARDAALGRLQRGLSLDRDVPRLLRVAGQGGVGRGTERAGRVAAQLEQLLLSFEKTPRKRSTLEAPPALTQAYVGLEFAWGFARLGLPDRARRLRDESVRALDTTHPVHRYLTRAYAARLEQALESASPETPLPPDVAGLLTAFDASTRYKVDKLRQASQVLEPQERLNSIDEWVRHHGRGSRVDRLPGLKGVTQPEALLSALAEREQAVADPALPEEERARVLESMLEALPQLPEVQAAQVLPRFVGLAEPLPPRLRLKVLEGALTVAGHFGRAPLVKQYVVALTRLLSQLRQDELLDAGPGLVAGVRSLRRVGLKDEAVGLFERAQAALKGDEARTLQARLGLAAGFAYLGQTRQAQAVLDEAFARLARESESLLMPDRLRLTRAAAQALGHSSLEVALPGLLRLAQQLVFITDGYSTRDLFCLSVVEFADALVLGHVGEDLALSETTRRFLEEDEFLVRSRIQRDVKGVVP